mmetsp:Transcript_17299/g.42372  ORF Transcript_17299/g.42372 Transcript_17299/m.42372 type:complete len:143 (-) Transcript_17299:21-449(-)
MEVVRCFLDPTAPGGWAWYRGTICEPSNAETVTIAYRDSTKYQHEYCHTLSSVSKLEAKRPPVEIEANLKQLNSGISNREDAGCTSNWKGVNVDSSGKHVLDDVRTTRGCLKEQQHSRILAIINSVLVLSSMPLNTWPIVAL